MGCFSHNQSCITNLHPLNYWIFCNKESEGEMYWKVWASSGFDATSSNLPTSNSENKCSLNSQPCLSSPQNECSFNSQQCLISPQTHQEYCSINSFSGSSYSLYWGGNYKMVSSPRLAFMCVPISPQSPCSGMRV